MKNQARNEIFRANDHDPDLVPKRNLRPMDAKGLSSRNDLPQSEYHEKSKINSRNCKYKKKKKEVRNISSEETAKLPFKDLKYKRTHSPCEQENKYFVLRLSHVYT